MSVEQLVVENADWIRKRAKIYYFDENDADDLASETIYKCLSQASRYDQSKGFKPWVCAIMANTYKTQYNRRRCILFARIEDDDDHMAKERSDSLCEFRDEVNVIRRCRQMSVGIDCVILYAKGYSYDEIADIYGLPVGTVKSRIKNARQLLRHELKR